jgi:hypothetical protein
VAAGRVPPPERIAAIASAARVTQRDPVLVVVPNRTVRRQWLRGVRSAGGRMDRLHVVTFAELAAQGGEAASHG